MVDMSYTRNSLYSRLQKNSYTDYVLVAGGIIIILLEFYLGRGFFEDEGSLGINIANRTPKELLQPLGSMQVAPIGFLLIIKNLTYLFGNVDRTYKILPMLASFVLMFKILQLKPSSGFNRTAFILLLILNPLFLRYSTEVKQYIMDLLLAVLVITNLHRQRNVQNFLVLAVMVWFSNVAYIMILPVSLFYLYANKKATGRYIPSLQSQKKDFLYVGICGLSMAVYYLLFVKGNSNHAGMLAFWSFDGGIYMPGKNYLSFVALYFGRVSEILTPFYTLFYVIHIQVVFTVLLLIFLVFASFKSEMGKFFLILLLTHLVFSSFALYPAALRLLLYMLPFLIYLVTLEVSKLKFRKWIFILSYCSIPISLMRQPIFPFRQDNTVSYIQHLNDSGYKQVYGIGGTYDIAEFYKESLKLPIQVIHIKATDKIDTTIPILCIRYRVDEIPQESLNAYTQHSDLLNCFGNKQISNSFMLIPKAPR
jgi:hypothetical protein